MTATKSKPTRTLDLSRLAQLTPDQWLALSAKEARPALWRQLTARRVGRPVRIAVINRKGGTGKSTISVHLAAAFAAWGLRARITDGDPQHASATYWFPPRWRTGQTKYTLLDVFAANLPLDQATYECAIPGVLLVPSLNTLAKVDSDPDIIGVETRLRDEFNENVSALGVDVEIIDCAPSLGKLTMSMLTAATDVVLTMNSSTLDIVGLEEMNSPLAAVRVRLNKQLRTAAVMQIAVNTRAGLGMDIHQQLVKRYPEQTVFWTPDAVAMTEAPKKHSTIFDYDPRNNAGFAHWKFAAALLARLPELEWSMA